MPDRIHPQPNMGQNVEDYDPAGPDRPPDQRRLGNETQRRFAVAGRNPRLVVAQAMDVLMPIQVAEIAAPNNPQGPHAGDLVPPQRRRVEGAGQPPGLTVAQNQQPNALNRRRPEQLEPRGQQALAERLALEGIDNFQPLAFEHTGRRLMQLLKELRIDGLPNLKGVVFPQRLFEPRGRLMQLLEEFRIYELRNLEGVVFPQPPFEPRGLPMMSPEKVRNLCLVYLEEMDRMRPPDGLPREIADHANAQGRARGDIVPRHRSSEERIVSLPLDGAELDPLATAPFPYPQIRALNLELPACLHESIANQLRFFATMEGPAQDFAVSSDYRPDGTVGDT